MGTPISYAPDGSVFAYSTRVGLKLRYADRLDAVPVAGGRRGMGPFFSPDGRWLGFLDGARLVKVPLAGGPPVTICDSCTGYNFHWGSDDTVRYHTFYANSSWRVLMAVSAQGGRPHEFARPDTTSGEAFRAPMLLPGRRTLLFSLYQGSASRLAALDLRTGAITRFDQPGFGSQWVNDGFVVLSNPDGTLIALPFDPERARATGPPVTIARDVLQQDAYSSRAAVSASGSILYERSGGSGSRQLMLVSRSGHATPLTPDPKAFSNPRFSPDGRRVAIDIVDPAGSGRDVWVLDVAQRVWSRLTTNGISNRPLWMPDGRRVVYSSNDDLWWMAADGSGRPESLLVAPGSRFAGGVTPDGRTVVFQEVGSTTSGIRAMALDSTQVARTVLPAAFGESNPALSPDGHWLAYQSDQTGQMEVYARSYPKPGARIPISLQGGSEPAWAHSGRELFYRSGDTCDGRVGVAVTYVGGHRAPSTVHGLVPERRTLPRVRRGAGRSAFRHDQRWVGAIHTHWCAERVSAAAVRGTAAKVVAGAPELQDSPDIGASGCSESEYFLSRLGQSPWLNRVRLRSPKCGRCRRRPAKGSGAGHQWA